ncbi:MAG: hypothetical protein QM775_13940 [Pirellulales bacterium]
MNTRSRSLLATALLSAAALLVGSLAPSSKGTIAAQSSTTSLAATPEETARRLAEPVDAAWSSAGLRESLTTRSRLSGVGLWVDRRVDPGAALELTVTRQPLSSVLEQVARAHDLGISYFGPIVYIGPRTTAANLRTVAALHQQDAQSLPLDLRTAQARKAAWRWESLAEPRKLAKLLADEARLTVTNLDIVPHDLWPAAELPPLSWSERLTLLLAGFDLSYRIDASKRTLTLVPSGAVAPPYAHLHAGRADRTDGRTLAATRPRCGDSARGSRREGHRSRGRS